MDVRCEQCGTEYEFDDDRLGRESVTVKCASCGHVFKVRKEEPSETARPAAAAAEKARKGGLWMVRQANGNVLTFKELTTLQKWIVERKVTREDEISKSGETWKRLGQIAELASFFQAVEAPAPAVSAPPAPPPPPLVSAPPASAPPPVPFNPPGAFNQLTPQPYPVPQVNTDPTLPVLVPPGSLPPGGPPPRITTSVAPSMDPRLLDQDDPVLRWQQQQRRTRGLMVGGALGLLVLAAGGGLFLRPEGKALLEDLKVRAGFTVSAGAKQAVEDAVAQALLGSPAALVQCEARTDAALREQPLWPLAMSVKSLCVTLQGTTHGEARHEAEALAPLEPDPARAAVHNQAADRERAAESELSRQAFELARRALQAAPDEPWSNLALAAYYVARRAPNDARAYLERARLPTFAEPMMAVVSAEWRVVDSADVNRPPAIAELGAVADRFPQARVARWRQAAWLAERKDPTAGTVVDRILKDDPQHERALGIRAYLAARAALTGAPAPPDAGVPPAALDAGADAEAPDAAVEKPAAKPADKPEEPKVRMTYDRVLLMADKARERGSSGKALPLYMKAMEMQPDRAEPHVGLGWCFVDTEKYGAAQGEFDRALQLNPSFAEAHLGLGEVYKARGDKKNAVKHYQKYLSILPGGPEADVARNALQSLGAP